MGNAYGPLGIGTINAAPRGIAGGPCGAPAVGGGLPGLPVRKTDNFTEVEAIAFYSTVSGPIRIFDKSWSEVTAKYIATQPTCAAAASHEQMWMPPRQRKYIGIGSYAIGTNPAGSVLDISVTPWAVYEDYSVITNDGSGSSYVRNMATFSNGYVAGFMADTVNDEAVCNIVTKVEVTGQPASFTEPYGPGVMKVYDDYMYQVRLNGTVKYSISPAGILSQVAASASPLAGSEQCSVAVNSDGSKVYVLVNSTLHIRSASLTDMGTVDLSAYSFTGGEAIEISPDDQWLLLGGQHVGGSNGSVLIVNTKTLAVSSPTVPTGFTNARFVGCAWYPDSDQYIVCGYSGARTHYGKRSAGGWLKNLYTDLFGSSGSTHGVAIITKG